jgi:N-acetylmuramoyl-L-alanine amidase
MSLKLKLSGAFAGTLAFVFTIVAAGGSGAAAQDRTPQMVPQAVAAATGANLLPGSDAAPRDADLRPSRAELLPPPLKTQADDGSVADFAAAATPAVRSLSAAAQTGSTDVTRELECLAGAIYFEAKSETLEGQLAVGRVVINRAKSGRFPASYCGVVYQRSQFSFIRGGEMPPINRASRDWHEAVAIARIADANTYPSAAEGALFFHAARVSPNWHLTRVARVDNHVFYR